MGPRLRATQLVHREPRRYEQDLTWVPAVAAMTPRT